MKHSHLSSRLMSGQYFINSNNQGHCRSEQGPRGQPGPRGQQGPPGPPSQPNVGILQYSSGILLEGVGGIDELNNGIVLGRGEGIPVNGNPYYGGMAVTLTHPTTLTKLTLSVDLTTKPLLGLSNFIINAYVLISQPTGLNTTMIPAGYATVGIVSCTMNVPVNNPAPTSASIVNVATLILPVFITGTRVVVIVDADAGQFANLSEMGISSSVEWSD